MVKTKRRNLKGGFLGSLLTSAIVPFSILGLQQTYRSGKYRKGKKSFQKSRRYRH
jgi:hypothetical protein